MNRQLLEIRSEIDNLLLQTETASKKLLALRVLENSLIQQQLLPHEREQTALAFDDDTRTISWASGTVKLAALRYRFVKTLWEQPAHQAELIVLESEVWDETGEITVPTSTMRSMVNRTNSEIQQQRFPYQICSVKNTENQLCGYELR
jgi:DNA-binding response OmpR family regulator